MLVAALIGTVLPLLTCPVAAKLLLDRLDQLETNMISPDQPPPPPSRSGRVHDENLWVKIVEAPAPMINARLGDRIEIECEAIGSPAPEIKWLRGERPIVQGRKGLAVAEKAGLAKMKSRLVIDCITRKDEGFYTCVSSAGGQSVKANPTLLIIEGIGQGELEMCSNGQRHPPRIVEWTPNAMETMGFDVQLPCLAVGSPAPSIYWLDPNNNIVKSARHQVSSSGDLTIARLAWSDMGEYTCVAESSEGRDEATTFIYPVLSQK